MKRLLIFFASSLLATTPYQEVEDLSHLPLLSPEFAQRTTAKLRLQNGLEVLLISDPAADQSAAAISVHAGSWNDPEEYPGMAHFCEHMLFMGTQKYPNDDFFAHLTNFGGTANAYTKPDRTVYMFTCQHPGFLSMLDRFAHFFIDPLFNPTNIAREMHAVDQEFGKSLEHDGWRAQMVWKETGNPAHPNRLFSCGNSTTLANIPQSALKTWHRDHYSANQMHVALYSSLPLEHLKEQAVTLFSAIPNAATSAAIDLSQPLSSPQQIRHITYIQPVQNRQQLTLSWELPPSLANDPSHPADLIAYALSRGQKYSLYETLKREGLIDTLSIQVEDVGGKTSRLFQISLDLTEKGIQHIEPAVRFVFQALASLRTTGIPLYLFEEKNCLDRLDYQYQSRQEPLSSIAYLADTLADEPLATYPRSQLLATDYSPETYATLLSHLTPESSAITLLAPFEKTQIVPSKKEQWMGAEYAIQPIPASWLSSWSSAKPHPNIRLAEPNPFLPTQFTLIPNPDPAAAPLPMTQSEFGAAYYARCSEFPIAKANIHLHILSPLLQPTSESQVLASLYLDHLTDLLHPTLQAAASSGLNALLTLDRSRIHLALSGFSEKTPLLLQEILRQMPLTPPTPEQFSTYFDRHHKAYANSYKELAYKQGKELLDSLLNPSKISSKEKLAALQLITYDDFLEFHKKLFDATYFEALFSGNLSLQSAESLWLDIVHALGKTPYPIHDHPPAKILHLPVGGPFAIHEHVDVQGNAALLAIEEGPFSFERRAAQEILSNALQEAFFNELRTKQKTGYIAATSAIDAEGRLFQFFLVQSTSHQPEDLLYRFELFLEEYLEAFPNMIPQNRFDALKASAICDLKSRSSRNLQDKSAIYDLIAFERGADFEYLDKRLAALDALSYPAFTRYAKEFFSRTNRKRLALLLDGNLPTPFVFEPLTPTELQEIATYSPDPLPDSSNPNIL